MFLPARSVAALSAVPFAVLFATMAADATAQTAEAPKCIMQNFATLMLHDDGLAISTDGSINSDKASILIDSGAAATLVTKAEAVKLGLSMPAQGDKGKKSGEDSRVHLSEFAIGSIELGGQRILASQRLADHPTFGALAGADFLMQHDMELSLAKLQLKFFNPVGCDNSFVAYWDSHAAMVPLSALSAGDRRPVVSVELDGLPLRALIDTGAPISVLSLSAAKRAGVTPKSPGITPMGGAAPGGKATSWLAPFHKFSIGDEEIKNLKLPILDLKSVINAEANADVPDMILGEDFLRAHHVLFAPSQQSFYFSYVGGNVFNMDTGAAASAPAAPVARP
jgi:predicted aspartyl protease